MDEIKSVISQLSPQDIAILKTMYNPEAAKADLSDNAQRVVAILDWLTPEEQQEAVNVEVQTPPVEEPEVPAEPEASVTEPQAPVEWEMPAQEEQMPNPAGNLEDFLI